jgi:hypothetical protein
MGASHSAETGKLVSVNAAATTAMAFFTRFMGFSLPLVSLVAAQAALQMSFTDCRTAFGSKTRSSQPSRKI